MRSFNDCKRQLIVLISRLLSSYDDDLMKLEDDEDNDYSVKIQNDDDDDLVKIKDDNCYVNI